MKKTWLFIMGLFWLLVCVTGCKDDGALDHTGNEAAMPMNTVFKLNLAIDGKNGMSRAAAVNNSTIGNTMESRINSVQLFVVPLAEDGSEQWNDIRFGEAEVPEGLTENTPVKVPISGITSNNHVYVGANMNREQANAFIRSKNGFYEMTRANFQTYYSAINQLAPFHPQWLTGANRSPENIVMFSTEALKADRSMINEEIDPETGAIKTEINLGTATLKRVVAKVLLTCESIKGKTADKESVAEGAHPDKLYVKTQKDLILNNQGPRGWIRQENVYYFINNMPRGVKFLQEYADKDLDGKDTPVPNYNLKEIIIDELGVRFSPIRFEREKIRNVYVHYDIQELYKHNQSFQKSAVWDENEYKNLITDQESAYSKEGIGMYTAENMFGVEEEDFTDEELKQMKEYSDLPFFTKIAIAAKFTPRFIFVTADEWNNEKKSKDGKETFEAMKDHKLEGKTLSGLVTEIEEGQYPRFLRLKCHNEEVAHEILTYSLKMHEHLTEGEYDAEKAPYIYPPETFFVFFRNEEIFFSTYGVASVGNPKDENWDAMIPYTRGWNYYYTYINNERSAPVEHVKEICIERNNYYILKLTSIGSLGTSVGDNNYIKVHTLKSNWQDGGTGSITIH